MTHSFLDPVEMIRDSLPDNDQYTHRFEIFSSDRTKVYLIAKHRKTGRWKCSCPGHIFHGHCKHLPFMMPFLLELDREAKRA